jgi:hypothetical protein
MAAWDAVDPRERQNRLADLGTQLEALVRSQLSDRELGASIDGFVARRGDLEDLATLHVVGAFSTLLPSGNGRGDDRQLPAEAWLSTATGSTSRLRVGGRDSIFDSSLSERHFERLLVDPWPHNLELRLA